MQENTQKISPIKQRILQFAEGLGISKRDFYKAIGVSRGTLESNTGITEDVMAKFIAAYPKVSVEWLVTGKGTMLNDERPTSKKESVIIYQSDPKDAAIIADKQLIIERDAELITSLREKIKELEMRISNKSLGLPSAPAVDTPSVGGKRASHK